VRRQVEHDGGPPGARQQIDEESLDEPREADAAGGPCERDDETLGEQLTNDTSPAGANRQPDRDFALP